MLASLLNGRRRRLNSRALGVMILLTIGLKQARRCTSTTKLVQGLYSRLNTLKVSDARATPCHVVTDRCNLLTSYKPIYRPLRGTKRCHFPVIARRRASRRFVRVSKDVGKRTNHVMLSAKTNDGVIAPRRTRGCNLQQLNVSIAIKKVKNVGRKCCTVTSALHVNKVT